MSKSVTLDMWCSLYFRVVLHVSIRKVGMTFPELINIVTCCGPNRSEPMLTLSCTHYLSVFPSYHFTNLMHMCVQKSTDFGVDDKIVINILTSVLIFKPWWISGEYKQFLQSHFESSQYYNDAWNLLKGYPHLANFLELPVEKEKINVKDPFNKEADGFAKVIWVELLRVNPAGSFYCRLPVHLPTLFLFTRIFFYKVTLQWPHFTDIQKPFICILQQKSCQNLNTRVFLHVQYGSAVKYSLQWSWSS